MTTQIQRCDKCGSLDLETHCYRISHEGQYAHFSTAAQARAMAYMRGWETIELKRAGQNSWLTLEKREPEL